MKEPKRVVREMLAGIAVWGIAAAAVLLVVSHHRLAMAAGVVTGMATAAGLLLHMYRHLDIALDLDERGAKRHTQLASMQRLGIMAVVLAVSMTQYRYIHPVGTVLGIFGLKISAFLQPKIRKWRMSRK